MRSEADIQRLITNHQRRLQKLKEVQALYGYSTEPVILLEIEEIEIKINELQSELKEFEPIKQTSKNSPLLPPGRYKKIQKVISNKQDGILAFVKNYLKENGLSPTFDEIRVGLNISSKSQVKFHIDALKDAGFLTYSPKTPRSISLTEKSKTPDRSFMEVWVEVPLGKIVAGEPIEIPEPILEDPKSSDNGYVYNGHRITVPISRDLMHRKDRIYALEVEGNSMIESDVNEGDIVIMYHLKIYDEVKEGDMVAAWVANQGRTTLKYIYHDQGRIRLQPANDTMNPIYEHPDEVLIQGRVIKIIGRED